MLSILSILVILLFELNSIVAKVDVSLIGIKVSEKRDFLNCDSVLHFSIEGSL
jgi:hypothetical protein